jgi:hypothetical protein
MQAVIRPAGNRMIGAPFRRPAPALSKPAAGGVPAFLHPAPCRPGDPHLPAAGPPLTLRARHTRALRVRRGRTRPQRVATPPPTPFRGLVREGQERRPSRCATPIQDRAQHPDRRFFSSSPTRLPPKSRLGNDPMGAAMAGALCFLRKTSPHRQNMCIANATLPSFCSRSLKL